MAYRPSRGFLVVTAVELLVLVACFAAWDPFGCAAARDINILETPAPATYVGGGFPLLRARTVTSVTSDPLKGWDAGREKPLGMLSGQDTANTVGEYRNGRGDILMAGTPDDGLLYGMTLRHEYGHALYEDLVLGYRHERGVGEYLRSFPAQMATVVRQGTPRWLAARVLPPVVMPLFDLYRTVPADYYGDTHTTENFGEFFAETYSRYLGHRVPLMLDGLSIRVDEGEEDPMAARVMDAISADQLTKAGQRP